MKNLAIISKKRRKRCPSVRYYFMFMQTSENSLNSSQPGISRCYCVRDEALVGVEASLPLYTPTHFLQPSRVMDRQIV